MKLHKNWKTIATKSWSIRLIVVAGLSALLSGLEVAFPFFSDQFTSRTAAFIAFGVSAGAVVARLIAQENFSDD